MNLEDLLAALQELQGLTGPTALGVHEAVDMHEAANEPPTAIDIGATANREADGRRQVSARWHWLADETSSGSVFLPRHRGQSRSTRLLH